MQFSIKKSDETVFSNNRATLGTLSAGWKPYIDTTFTVSGNTRVNSYIDAIAGTILVGSGGTVRFDKAIDTVKEIQISMTYIVA